MYARQEREHGVDAGVNAIIISDVLYGIGKKTKAEGRKCPAMAGEGVATRGETGVDTPITSMRKP